MKLMLSVLVILLLTSGNSAFSSSGEESKVSLIGFAGIGMSAFETYAGGWCGQFESGCTSLQVGAQLLYRISNQFSIGAECEFAADPFYTETLDAYGYYYWDTYCWMEMIGAFTKFHFSPDNTAGGYARFGIGSYSAEAEVEDELEISYDSGLGPNFGAGYLLKPSESFILGLEGVYHLVSLKVDNATESHGKNYWVVRLLAGIEL